MTRTTTYYSWYLRTLFDTNLHRVQTTKLCVEGVLATTVRTVGAFGFDVTMPISLAAVAVASQQRTK